LSVCLSGWLFFPSFTDLFLLKIIMNGKKCLNASVSFDNLLSSSS
jgi:hypothetical protein